MCPTVAYAVLRLKRAIVRVVQGSFIFIEAMGSAAGLRLQRLQMAHELQTVLKNRSINLDDVSDLQERTSSIIDFSQLGAGYFPPAAISVTCYGPARNLQIMITFHSFPSVATKRVGLG